MPKPTRPKPGFLDFIRYWKEATPEYRKLVAGLLFFSLLNSADTFLLLLMKARGMADQDIILIYILYNLVYAAAAYPLGALGDRFGLRQILVFGTVVFGGVYVGMAYAEDLSIFVLLFVMYGIYAAATEGIAKAWITNLSRKEDTATAIGFFTSFGSLTALASSTLAGLLWAGIGPQAPFLFSGVGAFVAAAYMMTVRRRVA